MERAEISRMERIINRELKGRFGPGAVRSAVLLQHGDDPAIEPGQLMLRVFIPPPSDPADYEQALAAWQTAHQRGMDTLRRELSLGCLRPRCSSSPSTTPAPPPRGS
jgi:hypothetical protein